MAPSSRSAPGPGAGGVALISSGSLLVTARAGRPAPPRSPYRPRPAPPRYSDHPGTLLAVVPLTSGVAAGAGAGGGAGAAGRVRRATATSPADGVGQGRGPGAAAAAGWQREVFDLVPAVGEVGFVVGRIAGVARRATVAPRVGGTGPNKFPRAVMDGEDPPAGTAPPGLVRRMARLLTLVGEVILVLPPPPPPPGAPGAAAADEWRRDPRNWEAHSPLAVSVTGTPAARVVRVVGRGEYAPGAAEAVRVYVPDDADGSAPYSAVRNCLAPMREIVGLSMHIAAAVDSRLAGAGMLTVSNMAEVIPVGTTGSSADEPGAYLVGGQGVAQAVTEAAMLSIGDRDHASAVVPIVVAQPDEARPPVHLTFGTKLDDQVVVLRDQCIRRLALGMDTDPSIMLGVGGSSGFSSWSIESSFFNFNIAPTLDDIAVALGVATGRPYAWDAAKVLTRPNKFVEVQAAYDRGEVSGQVLRTAAGLSEESAPEQDKPWLVLALRLVDESPSLLQTPGLPDVVAQCKAVLTDTPYIPAVRPASSSDIDSAGPRGRAAPPPAATTGARPASDRSPSSGAEGKPHTGSDPVD